MAVQTPNEQQIIRQLQANVRSELPELDPTTEKANFITGLVIAFAKSVHHFYLALADFANRQVHPQTATGPVLFRGWWTALTGLQRTPITAATGYIIATGTDGAIVPLGARFSSNSQSYVSTNSATVLTQSINAASLTYLDGLAVFETSVSHGMATGQTVTIAGALDAAYNGSFVITVTATNEFTYEPETAPSVAAGGGVTSTASYARVFVQAENPGQFGNMDGGQVLFETAIDEIESAALVAFSGISGGTDLESAEDFRERLLDALGSTLGMFTGEELRDEIKNIPGITRVWVRKAQLSPATGWPEEGQTKVLFMRDNDANPIPSAQEVADVKNHIINKLMPTHMVESNLIVTGPTPYVIDVNFDAISPDTASMRLAITAQLKQFFGEAIALGADVPQSPHSDFLLLNLQCAIKESVDLESGQRLQSFTLASPVGDVPLGPDDIPQLGQVIFQ